MGSTTGNDYPSQTLTLLGSGTKYNVALGGTTIVQMAATASNTVDAKYKNTGEKFHCIIWGGTNDTYLGTSPATTYANIKAYAQARKTAHPEMRVIILTILPRSDSGVSASFESDRQTINASLLADFPTATTQTNIWTGASYADYLVDVGSDATIGVAGAELNTTYYVGDKVHLKNAGYAIVAQYVANAIGLFPFP